jgi:hypothetical protein
LPHKNILQGKIMKALLMATTIALMVSSCGKSNGVSSGSSNSGINNLGTARISLGKTVEFEGVYDLIKIEDGNCGASIRIIKECGGYRVLSNHTTKAEDFCNISRNTQPAPTSVNPPPDRDSHTPPPDRDSLTPPPDRDNLNPPPDRDGQLVVTQEGNLLRSVIKFGARIFSNTLTLNENGILTKVSVLKTRKNSCVFQKR